METRYQPTVIPASPDYRPPKPKGWIIATIAVAVGLTAVVVLLLIQANVLSTVRDEGELVTRRAAATEEQLADVREDLDITRERLDAAGSDKAEAERRLVSCDRAISVGVKMDRTLHDLVDNVLYNESLAEWNRLWNQYDALGRQWASASNGCVGGSSGDFTFS
jgi:hypothetical protein